MGRVGAAALPVLALVGTAIGADVVEGLLRLDEQRLVIIAAPIAIEVDGEDQRHLLCARPAARQFALVIEEGFDGSGIGRALAGALRASPVGRAEAVGVGLDRELVSGQRRGLAPVDRGAVGADQDRRVAVAEGDRLVLAVRAVGRVDDVGHDERGRAGGGLVLRRREGSRERRAVRVRGERVPDRGGEVAEDVEVRAAIEVAAIDREGPMIEALRAAEVRGGGGVRLRAAGDAVGPVEAVSPVGAVERERRLELAKRPTA